MYNFLLWTFLSLPLLYLFIIKLLKKFSHRPARPSEESLYYLTSRESTKPRQRLRSIKEKITEGSTGRKIELSVIVPAYNEEYRLKSGLNDALNWLEDSRRRRKSSYSSPSPPKDAVDVSSYEVLIIDDGSSDNTFHTALDLAHQHALKTLHHPDAEIRVISLGKNRGKGGAVRHGILHARGEMILFVDADGATKFSDISKLIKNLKKIQVKGMNQSQSQSQSQKTRTEEEEEEYYGIAIGSRAHLVSSPTVVSRSKFRNFLMKAFHLYLVLLGLKDIRDTQCGFKLMTKYTAIRVVDGLHVEGWIFDVELLLRAKLMRPSIPIVEVPIEWEEIQGSKLSIFKDSLIMAIELFLIRINYFLGVWELD